MNCPHCYKPLNICEECGEIKAAGDIKSGICIDCVPQCSECGNDEDDCICDMENDEDDEDLDKDKEE